jgi:hypothetical protein
MAGSRPVALAKQKAHFWLWRGSRFDEDDSSSAAPRPRVIDGSASLELDALNKYLLC